MPKFTMPNSAQKKMIARALLAGASAAFFYLIGEKSTQEKIDQKVEEYIDSQKESAKSKSE